MYNEEDIRKVQGCLLEIFKVVRDVLDKMGIKYYAGFGTALGAVRHNGFIPWDDDMDILVFRDDYERFLKEGQQYLPKNYFIQDVETEPNYNVVFAKVRKTDTVFLEYNSQKLDINHGVYIDIFPIDYAPIDEKEIKKIDKKLKILRVRLSKGLVLAEPTYKHILRKTVTLGNMHDKKYYVRKFKKIVTDVKKGDMTVIYGNITACHCPKEWYGEGVMHKFEDTTIRLMTEYDKNLTQVYGDYMTPPPKEKQAPLHAPLEIKI